MAHAASTFSPAPGSPIPAGKNPNSLVVSDFNLDGAPDLAVANTMGNTVTVLLGDGRGGFAAADTFAAAGGPASIAVGDFNADGNSDLAIANLNAGTVAVFLGNGAGGFAPAPGSPFPVGVNPDFVAVGDFNQDGFEDLDI